MDLTVILCSGILTGILIGLFPVFPIYLGAFLLYITSTIWTPEQMLLFWAVSSIGSQFFCSVSTITLGIPGDASSLIYVKDIKKFCSYCGISTIKFFQIAEKFRNKNIWKKSKKGKFYIKDL